MVFLGDNRRRADDQDPLLTRPDDPNTYEVRTPPDGTTATIVKNYFTAAELTALLAPTGHDLTITMGRVWWWLSYVIS